MDRSDRALWVVFHLVVGEEVDHTGSVALSLGFRECPKEWLYSDRLPMVIAPPPRHFIFDTFVPGIITYETTV